MYISGQCCYFIYKLYLILKISKINVAELHPDSCFLVNNFLFCVQIYGHFHSIEWNCSFKIYFEEI